MSKEQAFLPNGYLVPGVSFERDDFAEHPEFMMGTVHVWLWRRANNTVELLVQQRSMRKKSHPGMYDISVAGHIDAGETPCETAVRECKEEVGLGIDESRLVFAFAIRKTNVPNVIAHVYVCEISGEFTPMLQEIEVDACEWISLDTLKSWSVNPKAHNLAPHGIGYYQVLIEQLERL